MTGWAPVAAVVPDIIPTRDLRRNLWCWVLGTLMVYCALFGVGKLLLRHWGLGSLLTVLSVVAAWQMSRQLRRGWGV